MAKPKEEKIWRLLDANINRAREGLRVAEDVARFVLDQPAAAKALRGMRHDLDALTRRHYRRLLEAREVAGDSGRCNPSKTYAGGLPDLLAANFKRCEEALRVLEEFGRLISAQAALRAQQLRFQVYLWERKLISNGDRSD